MPGLLAVGFEGPGENFDALVGDDHIDAHEAMRTIGIDTLHEPAPYQVPFQGGYARITLLAGVGVQDALANLLEDVWVPEQYGVGSFWGQLAQAALFGGVDPTARPELAFLGDEVLDDLGGDAGLGGGSDDLGVEAVLPGVNFTAGQFQTAGVGIAIGFKAISSARGAIDHPFGDEASGQVIVGLVGGQLAGILWGGQPGGQVIDWGKGPPDLLATAQAVALPAVAEHVDLPTLLVFEHAQARQVELAAATGAGDGVETHGHAFGDGGRQFHFTGVCAVTLEGGSINFALNGDNLLGGQEFFGPDDQRRGRQAGIAFGAELAALDIQPGLRGRQIIERHIAVVCDQISFPLDVLHGDETQVNASAGSGILTSCSRQTGRRLQPGGVVALATLGVDFYAAGRALVVDLKFADHLAIGPRGQPPGIVGRALRVGAQRVPAHGEQEKVDDQEQPKRYICCHYATQLA